MTKQTRAFHLNAMPEDVTIAFLKGEWYPLRHDDTEETFIYGQGHVKLTKKTKKVTLPKLETLTAKALKAVKDQYGYRVALGMIQGWGRDSLFHDNSYGLSSAKFEAYNMADLGECYDTFTDEVQKIGDRFIDSLLANGFTLQGTRDKGSLWYGYKDENDCGYLLGFCGIYERIKLHPLMYMEHSVGDFFRGRILPIFDSVGFDDLMIQLFMGRYYTKDFKESNKMLNKIVSVKDRIAHLTSTEIACDIERIFELQKSLILDAGN